MSDSQLPHRRPAKSLDRLVAFVIIALALAGMGLVISFETQASATDRRLGQARAQAEKAWAGHDTRRQAFVRALPLCDQDGDLGLAASRSMTCELALAAESGVTLAQLERLRHLEAQTCRKVPSPWAIRLLGG